MRTLTLNIKPQLKRSQKIAVEMNTFQFEKLAANFGFFSDDFLNSLKKAETDIKKGRVTKIKSLKDLRK